MHAFHPERTLARTALRVQSGFERTCVHDDVGRLGPEHDHVLQLTGRAVVPSQRVVPLPDDGQVRAVERDRRRVRPRGPAAEGAPLSDACRTIVLSYAFTEKHSKLGEMRNTKPRTTSMLKSM